MRNVESLCIEPKMRDAVESNGAAMFFVINIA
jgi:hypothetical protein